MNRSFFKISLLASVLASCAKPVSEERHLEAQTLYEVGISQLQDGNYPDAIANLQAASNMQPDSADIELNLGLAYFGAESNKNAIQHIERACGMVKNFALCWNNLSGVLNADGQYKEALVAANKALAILDFPTPELSWGNKGNALFNLGQLRESKAALEKALKVNPKHCRNRAMLSRTFLQLADFDNARQQSLLIRRFCPAEPRVLLWDAYLSYRLGFINEAKRTFEAIIAGFSDKQAIEDAQKALRTLNSERTLRPPAI